MAHATMLMDTEMHDTLFITMCSINFRWFLLSRIEKGSIFSSLRRQPWLFFIFFFSKVTFIFLLLSSELNEYLSAQYC